jgi:hypothetical protein
MFPGGGLIDNPVEERLNSRSRVASASRVGSASLRRTYVMPTLEPTAGLHAGLRPAHR